MVNRFSDIEISWEMGLLQHKYSIDEIIRLQTAEALREFRDENFDVRKHYGETSSMTGLFIIYRILRGNNETFYSQN